MNQRVRCSQGHIFHVLGYYRGQRLTCPYCPQNMTVATTSVSDDDDNASVPVFPAIDLTTTSSDPAAADPIASGQGGDFAGGGASSDWSS